MPHGAQLADDLPSLRIARHPILLEAALRLEERCPHRLRDGEALLFGKLRRQLSDLVVADIEGHDRARICSARPEICGSQAPGQELRA